MADMQNNAMGNDLQVPDSVIIKNDTMFWNAMKSEAEMLKNAGTECVVADVSYQNGVPISVIIEDYDPIANIAWLASLGADEVELVWKSPR